MEWVLSVLGVLGALGIGWWLSQRFGLYITHRHRVIEEQTKRVHQYIEGFYMPNVAFAEILEQLLHMPEKDRPKDVWCPLTFFRLAQWIHSQYIWAREIGGVYLLMDRTAESLLKAMHHRLLSFLTPDRGLGIAEYHAIANVLETDKEVARFFNVFQDRLNYDPLRSLFEKYKTWLNGLEQSKEIGTFADQLQGYCRLFLFEVNICYNPWYKTKPSLRMRRRALKLLEDLLVELTSKETGAIGYKEGQDYWTRILQAFIEQKAQSEVNAKKP